MVRSPHATATGKKASAILWTGRHSGHAALLSEPLESDLEIHLAPEIGAGTRVKVKSGPLRGMEGWVEQRYGMTTVLLRLDFIGQAAGG